MRHGVFGIYFEKFDWMPRADAIAPAVPAGSSARSALPAATSGAASRLTHAERDHRDGVAAPAVALQRLNELSHRRRKSAAAHGDRGDVAGDFGIPERADLHARHDCGMLREKANAGAARDQQLDAVV